MRKSAVTQMIERIHTGEASGNDDLFPLVYQELRQMARSRLNKEQPGHTLQATALVHEAFLRLTDNDDMNWEGRKHFFGAAAEAMRRILIDHARSKLRKKRGGDMIRVTLEDDLAPVADSDEDLIALSDALDQLEIQDASMAQIVKLRYFAGLTVEETADITNCSTRTINRQWTAARAWLRMTIDGQETGGASV